MKSRYQERDHRFGQLMLALREAIGLTQASLGKVLGISRRAIGDWEAGAAYPKAEHLKGMIVLGVKHRVFPKGREAQEIQELWRASHQRALLDTDWLQTLLEPAELGTRINRTSTQPNSTRPVLVSRLLDYSLLDDFDPWLHSYA